MVSSGVIVSIVTRRSTRSMTCESYLGEPNTNAFVQFVDFRGITYRFDARNATSNLQCRERRRYIGRVSAGILEEIEDQCATSGRVVSLKINGTF